MPRSLPKPLTAIRRLEMLIPLWHTNFLKTKVLNGEENTLGDLQELLSCASFMGVRTLVRLVSAKIATLMQGCRKIEQVRELLGI